VTGNPKKLEEVKHILAQGNLSIPLKSQALDCIHQSFNDYSLTRLTIEVDEVQGTTQHVAIHKCRQAADIVSQI
jgi:inosine/xanthosine triphosphate pyrophosphatase family protein